MRFDSILIKAKRRHVCVTSEGHPLARLKSSASSATRVLNDRADLAAALADKGTRDSLRQVARPNSISKTLRRAGVALILAPDPITAVPGAVLLGASLAAKGKEPMSVASVFKETRKVLDEMGSF
jgi:hypothetical protein